jgi:hypothetical protein
LSDIQLALALILGVVGYQDEEDEQGGARRLSQAAMGAHRYTISTLSAPGGARMSSDGRDASLPGSSVLVPQPITGVNPHEFASGAWAQPSGAPSGYPAGMRGVVMPVVEPPPHPLMPYRPYPGAVQHAAAMQQRRFVTPAPTGMPVELLDSRRPTNIPGE